MVDSFYFAMVTGRDNSTKGVPIALTLRRLRRLLAALTSRARLISGPEVEIAAFVPDWITKT
jgi:hypothetical protein